MCVIPVVCLTKKEGGVVKQHTIVFKTTPQHLPNLF